MGDPADQLRHAQRGPPLRAAPDPGRRPRRRSTTADRGCGRRYSGSCSAPRSSCATRSSWLRSSGCCCASPTSGANGGAGARRGAGSVPLSPDPGSVRCRDARRRAPGPAHHLASPRSAIRSAVGGERAEQAGPGPLPALRGGLPAAAPRRHAARLAALRDIHATGFRIAPCRPSTRPWPPTRPPWRAISNGTRLSSRTRSKWRSSTGAPGSEFHNPDYVDIPTGSWFALVGSVAVLAFVVLALRLLWLRRNWWWRSWLSARAWGWAVLVCAAFLGTWVAITTHPRPAYLFSLNFVLYPVIGMCAMVVADRWPRLKRLLPAVPIAGPAPDRARPRPLSPRLLEPDLRDRKGDGHDRLESRALSRPPAGPPTRRCSPSAPTRCATTSSPRTTVTVPPSASMDRPGPNEQHLARPEPHRPDLRRSHACSRTRTFARRSPSSSATTGSASRLLIRQSAGWMLLERRGPSI